MSKVVLYMSMSVDGFITGPDDGMDHGLGVNGERLHDWLPAGGVDPRRCSTGQRVVRHRRQGLRRAGPGRGG
jgi:hypothetical protein